MAGDDRNDLLDYYQRELSYLRHEGAAFAARYPRVAARLDLSGAESPDPHVERLLESVAFLTARIQRTLDADFPMIPAALLGVLYPHLVAPVPSLAIAQFAVDPDQARAATGFTLPDDTPLFAEATDGLTCRFRTAYPVDLWPIEVTDAAIQAPAAFAFLDQRAEIGAVLRVSLRGLGRLGFADMAPRRLRFHLHGGSESAGLLHELLLNEVRGIAVRPSGTGGSSGGTVRELPDARVLPVGFAPDEDVLPWPRHAHQGYRLIQEYFVFPEKYLFVDVDGLEGLGDGKDVDLLFLLGNAPRRSFPLDRDAFKLNCAPIVNLFRKTTEPIRLDQTQVDYRLTPDSHRERSTEIHSILKVSASSAYEDDSRIFHPFHSFDHGTGRADARAFWSARRQPTGRADLPGTDLLLSFLDLDFKPTRPPAQVVFAHTLCTNRGVAEQMPAGARLEIEVDAPLRGIACLTKPTPQRTPPLAGQTLWRLVSHLSLNHLSLDGEGGLAALREILRLYAAFDDATVSGQVAGLSGLSCRLVVRRVGGQAWRGFCRGSEITLELDEDRFVGSHPFLLASVLNRFFGLYAAVNSFTQLVLTSRQRNGTWKTWPPLAGDRPVL